MRSAPTSEPPGDGTDRIVGCFPDVLLWMAADGTVLGRFGRGSAELLPRSEAAVGQRLQDLADRDLAGKFARAIAEMREGRDRVRVEFTWAHPGGDHRWVEALFVSADVGRILVVVRDISDRKAAKLALQHSISILQATLEATADGIIVVDSTGRIVASNRRFVDMWQIPDEVMASGDRSRVLALVGSQVADPEAFRARVRELDGNPQAEVLDEIVLLDGRVIERSARPHRVAGRIVGRVLTFSDVTAARSAAQALREQEETLRQVQKMEAIGLLAGSVAHDFNNLLTAITGYTSMALEQLNPHDPLRADLSEVLRAGESAAGLTRQLLAFSRQQVMQPRVVNLSEIVRATESWLRRLIGEQIELITRLRAPIRSVHVDPGQIEQIVVNLAVNARDAMPNGGSLMLETGAVTLSDADVAGEGVKPGDYVMLTVTDTGTGIPESARAHIFEPFFSTKKPGEGTGLGLSTVYGIVRQSGGIIRAYSEVGAGTSFEIYFPAAATSATPDEMPAGDQSPRGHETVLIAEDQPEVRAVMRSLLRRRGYHVIAAANGAEALRLATRQAQPLDLLITDVAMPGISGPDLAAALQSTRPGLRVLFASGYPEKRDEPHGCIPAGAPFIAKPFLPATFLAKVREVLDSPVVREPDVPTADAAGSVGVSS